MIRVHHLRYSRSTRILWLLEEIGEPYELVIYDRDPKTFRAGPELKTIYPLGKAPVIEDDGRVIAESGAIIQHLIARHAHGRLGPEPSDPKWIEVLEWLHYGESSGMLGVIMLMMGGREGLPSRAQAYAQETVRQTFEMMERALADGDYLVGGALSGADIQMQYVVEVAAAMNLVKGRPTIEAYNARLTSRPAHRRAIDKGGPIPLPRLGS